MAPRPATLTTKLGKTRAGDGSRIWIEGKRLLEAGWLRGTRFEKDFQPEKRRLELTIISEALFEQGRAAMAAGSYDIACARFRDSDKLDPAVGTRFNLADCEERRGRLATAWSLFRGVLSELAHEDDRRPIAEQRAKPAE